MSLTPVLGLDKPDVGADQDAWGAILNVDLDKIDAHAGSVNAALAALNAGAFPAGTRLLFQQSAAPTGWTKDASAAMNDKALRIVSGTAGSGGTLGFGVAFTNRGFGGNTSSVDVAGSVGDTVLTEAQLPAHSHFTVTAANSGAAISAANYLARTYDGTTNLDYALKGIATPANSGLTSPIGSGQAHSHSFASAGAHLHTFAGNIDLAVAYVDVIVAVKN